MREEVKHAIQQTNNPALHGIYESLSDVNESCHVAVCILNDMLTVDKMEGGKLVVELEESDPLVMLKEAYNPFKLAAVDKKIRFTLHIEDESCLWWKRYYVKIDKFKFAQVLRNLVSNAFKFTPADGQVVMRMKLVGYDPSAKTLTAKSNGSGSAANEPSKSTTSKARLLGKASSSVAPEELPLSGEGTGGGSGEGVGMKRCDSVITIHDNGKPEELAKFRKYTEKFLLIEVSIYPS